MHKPLKNTKVHEGNRDGGVLRVSLCARGFGFVFHSPGPGVGINAGIGSGTDHARVHVKNYACVRAK
jgi:hypothetical protein